MIIQIRSFLGTDFFYAYYLKTKPGLKADLSIIKSAFFTLYFL
ncbi:hypothetical protein EMIT036CA2_30102 [Chryseobacterium sp. IT-36CA2]